MRIILFLFFLSRLPFLRTYPVFYDSFEYAKIAETINFSNFTQVTSSSHQPTHTFYFLTILLFKQVFFFFQTDIVLVLISFIFGFLTAAFWYLFVKECFNKEKAFFASLLLLLFPYFFIANTNILYESEMLFFQIATLYCLAKAVKLDEKIVRPYGSFVKFAILAGFFFGFSISIFTGSLLILPVFLALLFKKERKSFLLTLTLSFTLALLIPLLLDALVLKSPFLIMEKYQLHFGDFVSFQGGIFTFIYRLLRNIVLESAAILSPAGAIILLLTIIFYSLNTKYLILNTLYWFLPPLFLMQFWHSGLYGRLGLFLVFPASLIIIKTVVKPWQKALVLFILLIFFIPCLVAQTQRPPIYRYYNLIKDTRNLAILTSDSNRFLYQKNNLPSFVFSPGNDLPEAEKFIKENLKAGKTVLIDSAGLNYPYLQFDGNSYHPLSLHPKSLSHVASLLEKFKIEAFKTDLKNKKIYFKRIDWLSVKQSLLTSATNPGVD